MPRVIFQKREYSENAAQYFPKKYARPFKKQFEAIIEQKDLSFEYFREVIMSTCAKSGLPLSGDWQAMICHPWRSKVVSMGRL